MTEIAIRPDNTPDLVGFAASTSEAFERLGRWVTAASDAHRLVAPLVVSYFVPDAYKPKVDPRASAEEKQQAYEIAVANGTAAVLQGLSLGLDPLVSMQQIFIIKGRPGMYAKIKVALVQSRGHQVWTEESTDERAVVCGQRKGSSKEERVERTIEQARKAGWTVNDSYAKTPADMLWARAAGRVCERIANDVLMGIPSVEELHDLPDDDQPAAPARVTAADILGPAAPAAADDTQEQTRDDARAAGGESSSRGAQPPQPPAGPGINSAQQKKMHALLAESDLADRAFGLAYISEVVGRTITSSKELTKAEAARVIDRLENPTRSDAGEPPLDEPPAGEQ